MLMLPSSKMEKIRSSSLRSPPSSGAARHLLPQAGEGLPHPAGGRRADRQVSRRWEKGVGSWDISPLGPVQRLPRRPRDLRRQLRRGRRRQVFTKLRVHPPPLGDPRIGPPPAPGPQQPPLPPPP